MDAYLVLSILIFFMIAITQPIIEGAKNKKNNKNKKNKNNKNKNNKNKNKSDDANSKYKGSEQCFINYNMDDILSPSEQIKRLFQCLNKI